MADSNYPKISVIIPCFNGARFILSAVESALAQGDLVSEIIVIDDASTDRSSELIVALNNPKVKLFTFEKNSGISIARNFGLSKSTGDYIAFLDADDLWTDGRLELMYKELQDTGQKWCFGYIEHFFSNIMSGNTAWQIPPIQIGYFAGALLVEHVFFRKVGDFNPDLRVGEFIDWFDRARQMAGNPAKVNHVVLRRRIHGENTSIIKNGSSADYLKVAALAIKRKKSLG